MSKRNALQPISLVCIGHRDTGLRQSTLTNRYNDPPKIGTVGIDHRDIGLPPSTLTNRCNVHHPP